VQGLESKEVTINPPEGWAVCNGLAGTPNLIDYFIRGTDDYNNIGHSGGAENHSHSGQTGNPTGIRGINAGVGRTHQVPHDHTHPLSITENNHIPPFVCLVYIMKL
jgi:hypothetical protein